MYAADWLWWIGLSLMKAVKHKASCIQICCRKASIRCTFCFKFKHWNRKKENVNLGFAFIVVQSFSRIMLPNRRPIVPPGFKISECLVEHVKQMDKRRTSSPLSRIIGVRLRVFRRKSQVCWLYFLMTGKTFMVVDIANCVFPSFEVMCTAESVVFAPQALQPTAVFRFNFIT